MAVSGYRKDKINSTVLQWLLKLRLFCNNGKANTTLQIGSTGLPSDPDEALTYLEQDGLNTCAYCNGPIYLISDVAGADDGTFIWPCCYLVCHNCLPHHHLRNGRCPTCTAGIESPISNTLSADSVPPESIWQNADTNLSFTTQYPSKLWTLLSDIWRYPSEKR